MRYTPADILRYVYEENLEFSFMNAIMMQTDGYSIAEIADKRFTVVKEEYRLKSVLYKLNVTITDDDIVTAIRNELYVSAFLSRKDETYQVHFLVHRYPVAMKEQFEEQITREVVQYMVAKTIVALRLDTPEKVNDYLKL